jgi:hypothetical protein
VLQNIYGTKEYIILYYCHHIAAFAVDMVDIKCIPLKKAIDMIEIRGYLYLFFFILCIK